MDIFLVCHADTEPFAPWGDSVQPLTAQGRRQAQGLGERLRWVDCSPTHVWTSPHSYAVQTAQIVVAALGVFCELGALDELSPGGVPHDVVVATRALPAHSAVMLVGHAGVLTDVGRQAGNDTNLAAIQTAEAVRIVDGRVRWRFAWNAEAPVS